MTAFYLYAPLQFQHIPMLFALHLQLTGLRLLHTVPTSPSIITSFAFASANGAVYIENVRVECSRRYCFGDIHLTLMPLKSRQICEGTTFWSFWTWKDIHVHKVYAHEVNAREMHAHKMHAYEMHAHEVRAYEMHVYEIYTHP